MDLKFYMSLFLRRLPYFLIMVALGTAIGLSVASVLPPAYRAQARLLVESEQIPGNLAASTVRTETTEQLQIIQQRILTRANLLEMSNRLRIYAQDPDARRMNPDEIVADLRNRVQISVTGGAQPRRAVQATIVTVSFRAPSAEMSATVTNELVTMILRENVAMRTGASAQTLDFFNQEVQRLDQALAQLGARILEFKTANQTALPDSLEFRRRQQVADQERLVQLEREETMLRDRRSRLVTLYETTGQVEMPGNRALTPEERQLKGLQDQLSGMLAVLSPANPRVKVLENQIETLERTVAAQAAASGRAAAGLSAYEVQLADIDGQISFLADQKAQTERRLEELRVSIEETPRNAIALEVLERDYANTRVQYDQAVANRARAQTGDLIESLAKGGRISVIEQATVPREPASPNRPMIAAAGVGGGFALGLALVVALELLNTAIRRPVDLTARLGITPIATLPFMRTPGQIRRRRVLIVLAFLIVAAGIPAALWAIQTYYLPLDLILDRILGKLRLAMAAPGGASFTI